MDATLGYVIDRLKLLPPETVISPAFGGPHSYRGYYDQVAFSPLWKSTAGEMLKHAEEAIGPVFSGYKGGDYTYDRGTTCWVAEYGNVVGDALQRDEVDAWGSDNRNQVAMVPINESSLPQRPSGKLVSADPIGPIKVSVSRVLSLSLDPDAFPGGEPDVVSITMGGEPVRYLRETEVR